MSDWVIYPWNVIPLSYTGIFLILGVYISRIPKKSDTTKTLMWALFLFALGIFMSVLNGIASNSGWEHPFFESGTLDIVVSISPYLMLFLFARMAYLLGTVRFAREQKVVEILVLVIGICFFVSDVVFGLQTGTAGGVFFILFMIWTIVLLIRKWRLARKNEDASKTAYLAFLVFILVNAMLVILDAGLVKLGADLTAEVIGEISGAVLPVVLGLLFMQFIPEATSLESKFVAIGVLVVVVMTQLGTSPVNANYELRYEYAPNLEPISITFIPDGTGGYRAEGTKPVFLEQPGDTLSLGDESAVAVKTLFPISMYGIGRDSIYVSPNGLVLFERRSDDSLGYLSLARLSVPAVAPLSMDLDPSEGGSVTVFSSADSMVVTWKDIPMFHDPDANTGFFPVNQRLMNAQVVLRSDSSITITRGATPFRPLNWAYGISPGLAEMQTPRDSIAWRGTRGTLIATQLPFEIGSNEQLYFEERNIGIYQAWSRAESFRLLRNALIAFILILLAVPAYYRLSIRRRLHLLMDGLGRVNDGDLSKDVPAPIQDEVGQLSKAFNGMTASLRTYANNMEDLVEERTAELKATQAQLIEQEKLASLGSLTAGIAHEIKNPLNFVNNFAEVAGEMADEALEAMAKGDSDELRSILAELKANSGQITKHGRRADDIVKAMMQHARGGASEREEVQLNTFLEEYANLAWHGRRAKEGDFQAELVRDFSDEVGSLKAMPQELGRVVLNLLNNAFDAVRGVDSARVTIATRHADGNDQISVSDNGPGIPEDIRQKIFEPFFTTKATGEGTGLGLSLSYDIVTKGHSGTMTVAKAEGGGAEFIITIPK